MDGQKQIADMMGSFRNQPPGAINRSPVLHLLDYQISLGKNVQTGETWPIDLPASNVLQFVLEDGSKISARPSGTEPKIKFYFSVHEKLSNRSAFEGVDGLLQKRIDAIIADLKLL
jgi:phosphoglucomutase